MPQIILGPGNKKVDGSVQKQVMGFLFKLAEDDTAPGLHIEPMHSPADARARGRVARSGTCPATPFPRSASTTWCS